MPTTYPSGSVQLIELTNQTGDTIQPASYTWTPANSAHATKAAYLGSDSATVVPITGIMRSGVPTSTLVSVYARNTVSSGTPAKKKLRLLVFSSAGYPSTTPTSATAITLTASDAPYLIGHIDIDSSAWSDVTSTVAAASASVNLRVYNADSTPGTSVYVVAVNNDSSYTPASGEKIIVDFAFKLN